MSLHDEYLVELARRLYRDYPDQPERFREALQASLLPIIRCALRSGIGERSLVRWVRRKAARLFGKVVDPVKAAPPLARVLGDRLLARIDPRRGQDTVMEKTGRTCRASA